MKAKSQTKHEPSYTKKFVEITVGFSLEMKLPEFAPIILQVVDKM
jgi:hypothetical protein